ncbi:MAG TPA: hypothetical protein VLL03_00655 [Burkholderiales bacterium]|nr:hypothetical protein [Burkholderiales bacterium]
MLSKRVVSGLALGAAMLISAAAPVVTQAHDRVYIDSGYTVYPGNSYYGYHRYCQPRAYFPYYSSNSYYYGSGYGYSHPAYGNRLTIIYRSY